MQQEIEIYIRSTYSEEKIDLLIDCFQVLENYDLEDYSVGFIDILMETGSKDQYQTQIEFETLMKNNLLNILHVQGVQINDEADLPTIKEIASSLLLVQNYEDKQTALSLVESDFDSEERLCELLQLVSTYSVDRLMVAIESVDEGVFMKLREVYTEEIDEVIEQEDKQDIISRLKLMKTYIQYDEAIAFKLITKSVNVGMQFDFYFSYLKNKIEDMDVTVAAKELATMFTMSRDTYKSPIEEFSKKSGSIFTDIDKISRVNVCLVKIFSDFEMLYKTYLTEQKMRESNA